MIADNYQASVDTEQVDGFVQSFFQMLQLFINGDAQSLNVLVAG